MTQPDPITLKEIGLRFVRPLDEKDCKDRRLACADCGYPHAVYGAVFIQGKGRIVSRAYCYPDLLKRCRAVGALPMPIREDLYDRLKRDMGLD